MATSSQKEWLASYGDHKIVGSTNQSLHLLKTVVLDREETYGKLCARFEARRQLGESIAGKSGEGRLARVYGIKCHETRGFCSTLFKLEVGFEIVGHSLESELTHRKKNRSYFSANSLEQILQDSLLALKQLWTIKHSHNNLRPCYLLLTPGSRAILLDNLHELDKDDPLAPQKHNSAQSIPLYTSPAVLEQVCSLTTHPSQRTPPRGHKSQQPGIQQKPQMPECQSSGDLFALGLIMLEAGLLKEVPRMVCNPVVFRQLGSVDWKVLDELVEDFGLKYPRLKRKVAELVSQYGPARTDPNYLAKSQIEEICEGQKFSFEDSWDGTQISNREALDLFKTDQPDAEFVKKMDGLIFNSNHNLDSDTPRDSFLEDSLIVAHHISPVSQNLQPKLREGFPKNHANIQGNEPYHGNVLKFVSDFPQNPEPSKPHLSSLLQDASGQSHIQQSNQIPRSPNRPERITFNPHPAASPVSTTKIFQQQPYQISSPIRIQVPTSQPLDPEPVRSDLKRIISSNQRQTEQSPVTPRKLRKRFIQKVDTQVSQMIVVTEKENICLNNSFKANDCYSASKPKPNNPLEFRFTDQNSPMRSPLKGHREYSVHYMTPTKSPKNEAVASHKSFNPFNLY